MQNTDKLETITESIIGTENQNQDYDTMMNYLRAGEGMAQKMGWTKTAEHLSKLIQSLSMPGNAGAPQATGTEQPTTPPTA